MKPICCEPNVSYEIIIRKVITKPHHQSFLNRILPFSKRSVIDEFEDDIFTRKVECIDPNDVISAVIESSKKFEANKNLFPIDSLLEK